MAYLEWLQKDLSGSEYLVGKNKETIGRLRFPNFFKQEAVCQLDHSEFSFIPEGTFSNNIKLLSAGKAIGTIKKNFLGPYELNLLTGEKYFFRSDNWQQNWHWHTPSKEEILSYKVPLLSMQGKGSIELNSQKNKHLSLLTATGLYLRSINQKETGALVAVFIPIFVALLLS